jgi:hypothetical protein
MSGGSMTRDELAALIRDVVGLAFAEVKLDTIMLAVDNHVDYMIDIAFDELREGVREHA